MFRLVEQPELHPRRCAVLPQLGHQHERGYLDTGNDLPSAAEDPRIYVSVQAVEEMAQQIGLMTNEQVEVLVALNEQLQQRVEELEREASEFDAVIQAVDVIESAGFRARKKSGRAPKKQQDPVAA